MGFSVAAAAAILFAGAVVSFSILAGSIQQANDAVRGAEEAARERAQEVASTGITLLNGTANGTAIELNFTNSGSSVLHVDGLDIVVNGTLRTSAVTLREVDGVAATTLWAPGQVLHLRLTAPEGPTASIKLVADNGYALYGQVV
jgi:archaellum component FlaF (FlaF/FlaG flagellin family)